MEKTILLSEKRYGDFVKDYNDIKGELYKINTYILPPLKYDNKQLKDKLSRRNQLANGRLREIKKLQGQVKTSNILHLEANKLIEELRTKINYYEGPEVMGKCNKCSWQINR